jgi:Na+-translocating ferredoxin:NAD+ oxidoreductase RnfD subunit
MTEQRRRPADAVAWDRLVRFAKTPKGYVTGGLVLLTMIAGLTPIGHPAVPHVLAAVAAAIVFDWLVALVLRRPASFSVGGVITALILADVLSGLTPTYVVVLTTVIALASKHILKRGRKPVFNPAAVGLLVSIGLFSTAQSWWAGMPLMSLWHLPILLAVGAFVSVRVRKYPQVLAFLGTYGILLLAMAAAHVGLPSATPADALRPPFINAALFLAFFMLTDPPTTPATLREQLQFAVISAAVSVVVYALVGGLAYLLVGLLAGNLWTFWLAWASKRSARNPAKATRALPPRAAAGPGAGA